MSSLRRRGAATTLGLGISSALLASVAAAATIIGTTEALGHAWQRLRAQRFWPLTVLNGLVDAFALGMARADASVVTEAQYPVSRCAQCR